MDDAHTEDSDPNASAVDALGHKLTAVGGGKGGVGKSLTSVNLATYFALQGRRVVLIDGDLGGADLHTLLGMAPPRLSLASFIKREVETLDEILVETPVPGLRLMAGGSDILGLANPQFAQKMKLIRGMLFWRFGQGQVATRPPYLLQIYFACISDTRKLGAGSLNLLVSTK